jgi:hypothetical protein
MGGNVSFQHGLAVETFRLFTSLCRGHLPLKGGEGLRPCQVKFFGGRQDVRDKAGPDRRNRRFVPEPIA